MKTYRVQPESRECVCEWPDTCGGSGLIRCVGCGGNLCVCLCGGEMPCGGCDECIEPDEYEELEEEHAG